MTARARLLAYLALLLLALAFFLPGQASLPPLDRDESRYMQATVQMFETGNFLDIRFQDQARYLQPAGIYWLQAASVALLSDPEARAAWAHRVTSLVGATLAVLLTAAIGNLLFGAPAGFLAAVLMAASLVLGVEARMAKIDATLLAAVLAAQCALAKAYLDAAAERRTPARWAATFWLTLGLGLMLKGPVILLVTFGTILVLAISERRAAWLRRLRPHWGVPLMLAVALPWTIAIAVSSNGRFLSEAIGHSMLGKVATGQQSHGAPPGYYLALFAATFWPGSLFAVLAVPFVWRRRREPAVRFCLCWIAPTWLVFELIVTKLPHYVMPTYPAIACLAAAGLLSRGEPALGRWPARLTAAFAALWLAIAVALAGWLPVAARALEGRVDVVGVLTALFVVALAGASLVLLRRARPLRAVASAAAAALVLFASAYGYQLPHLTTIWLSPRIAEAVARVRPCEETTVATVPYAEPSLVFLLGTDTKLTDVGGAAQHLASDPACALALIGAEERSRFLALLAAARLAPRELERIEGVDYSNGKRLELTLFSASPAG